MKSNLWRWWAAWNTLPACYPLCLPCSQLDSNRQPGSNELQEDSGRGAERTSEAGRSGHKREGAGAGDGCRWARSRSKHSSQLSMGSLRNQAHTRTHTYHTRTRTQATVQAGCVDPPAVFPFCFCSKTHILSDSLNPSIAVYTHAAKHHSHTLQWVCGGAELSHAPSHWQRVCRVCNGPTGELILLTSRVRNISSPPRERSDQGQLNTHTHTHAHVAVC